MVPIIPALLSALLLTSLQPPGPAPAAQAAGPAAVQEVGIDEKLGSTVVLNQPLRGEDGSPVNLAQLVDKPTLLTLNYFGCPGLCTAQLQGVVDVLNLTRAEPGRDFQVITVSFDPRDTAEIAAQKRLNYFHELTRPVPLAAWRFLTGGQGATQSLADAVGFRFKRQNEDFIHPAALIVLSPTGEITRYLYGISYLPADLEMAVQEATRGQARPTINTLLRISHRRL